MQGSKERAAEVIKVLGLDGIWIVEALFHIENVLDNYSKLRSIKPKEVNSKFQVFSGRKDIHNYIVNILGSARSLYFMVFDDAPQRIKCEKCISEKEVAYEIRKRRVAFFKEVMPEFKAKALKSRDLRNTNEHFSEYLDELGEKYDSILKNHSHLCYNWNVSSKEVFQPPGTVYYIRNYEYDADTYHNFGKKFALTQLIEECKYVQEKIKSALKENNNTLDLGGILTPIATRFKLNEENRL